MQITRTNGFSLVETIVYIGILSVIAGVFTGVFQSVIKTQLSENSQNEVTSQLNFAISTMQRFVKGSSVISFDGCGSTSTLSLIMPQEGQSPTTLYAQNGKLYVKQGSAAAQAITDESVTVDSLEFKKYCNAGAKDTVEISIAMTKAHSGEQISRSLTSAVSRVDAVTFDSTLLPPVDATYDVGLWPTLRWRNGAFSGQLRAGELCIADDCKSSWSQIGGQWTTTSTGIYYSIGNVGVGTSSMPQKFSLDGNAYVSGNIGIGTSTPAYRLDVAGNARFSGTVSAAAPVAPSDLATKAYVDAIGEAGSGSSLYVYKHDGTTSLGIFSGFVSGTVGECLGWAFFSNTGGVRAIQPLDCLTFTPGTLYYTTANCPSSGQFIYQKSCCSQSQNCAITDGTIYYFAQQNSFETCTQTTRNYYSYRAAGVCHNVNDSDDFYTGQYPSSPPICGGNGACIVK